MNAFKDWLHNWSSGRVKESIIAEAAWGAACKHQREVDAKLVEADNPLLNYAICRNIVKTLAKAIREQKID